MIQIFKGNERISSGQIVELSAIAELRWNGAVELIIVEHPLRRPLNEND